MFNQGCKHNHQVFSASEPNHKLNQLQTPAKILKKTLVFNQLTFDFGTCSKFYPSLQKLVTDIAMQSLLYCAYHVCHMTKTNVVAISGNHFLHFTHCTTIGQKSLKSPSTVDNFNTSSQDVTGTHCGTHYMLVVMVSLVTLLS